jgi:hypothetical protein
MAAIPKRPLCSRSMILDKGHKTNDTLRSANKEKKNGFPD